MARSLACVSLLGGVVALPFLDDLLDLWEKFFGTPVRSNMRKTLRDFGGPVLEKMGMAGIPALMGIDISGSLKMGLPFTSLAGAQGTPGDTVYRVYAGLGKKGLNAMSAAEREDYLRALEFASPAFIEAALKAYRTADRGATTARGKVLTDEQGKPIQLGTGEAIAQAAVSARRDWRRFPASIGRWRTSRATSRDARTTSIPATAWLKPRRKGRRSSAICSGST
jgi:hypothetical protein